MDNKYQIIGIDPKLHKDFKTACAYYGITAKATLSKHMENIVKDYLRDRKIYDKPKVYKHLKGKKK